MRLVAIVIAVVALLAYLGITLRSKHATVPALAQVQQQVAEPVRETPVLDRSETPRAQPESSAPVEPISSTSASVAPDATLAPDGKPWAKSMLIGELGNQKSFTIEWIGNTKRMFHDNGQLYSEVAYVNGKREGVDRSWHRNGQEHGIDNWRAGKREGAATYFNDKGVLLARGAYKASYRDGPWESWYEDGTRHSLGSYRSDPAKYTQVKQGQWTVWRPGGSVDEDESGFYENDVKQ